MDVTLNDPFELPSLEEIQEMENKRSQAIESLQISSNSVKCQRCGVAVPTAGKLTRKDELFALNRAYFVCCLLWPS